MQPLFKKSDVKVNIFNGGFWNFWPIVFAGTLIRQRFLESFKHGGCGAYQEAKKIYIMI